MLTLVDELKEKTQIIIMVDTYKDFIYGTYLVDTVEFKGIKNTYASIKLIDATKKIRYFRDIITFEGFRMEFTHTPTKFIVFADLTDALMYFCKELKKHPEYNIKVAKKFRNKFPTFFY